MLALGQIEYDKRHNFSESYIVRTEIGSNAEPINIARSTLPVLLECAQNIGIRLPCC